MNSTGPQHMISSIKISKSGHSTHIMNLLPRLDETIQSTVKVINMNYDCFHWNILLDFLLKPLHPLSLSLCRGGIRTPYLLEPSGSCQLFTCLLPSKLLALNIILSFFFNQQLHLLPHYPTCRVFFPPKMQNQTKIAKQAMYRTRPTATSVHLLKISVPNFVLYNTIFQLGAESPKVHLISCYLGFSWYRTGQSIPTCLTTKSSKC